MLGCFDPCMHSCAPAWLAGLPQVMEAASKTLTPVVLELGGKDPVIIADDADLNNVGCLSAGQAWAGRRPHGDDHGDDDAPALKSLARLT